MKYRTLSVFFLLVQLLLAFSASFSLVSAQTMNLALDGEVRLDAGDLDGRSYFPKYDQNDELCALIKVTVTNKLKNPLSLETGAAGVMEREERENGEIWFWVPYQVKNLKFSCFEYTPLPTIPVKLERGKVYRLTLRSDAQVQTFTNVSTSYGFLKLQIYPEEAANALVSIGKTESYELESGYAQGGYYASSVPLEYGEYYYQISHKYCEPKRGKLVLDKDDQVQDIRLQPAFGYLEITSEPSGAILAIDDNPVGVTPWRSEDIFKKGEVRVRVQMNHYAVAEQTILVEGNGQLQTHHIRLAPQFGTVTCRSEMADAEIWVDQQKKGTGSWTGPLSSQGTHILEARKEGHQSQSVSFTVQNGQNQTQTVGAPIPMYGTLVLSTTPAKSEVFVDGKSIGVSPIVEQLLVGSHQVTLKMDGYENLTFSVEMEHNQRKTENRTMKKAVVQQHGQQRAQEGAQQGSQQSAQQGTQEGAQQGAQEGAQQGSQQSARHGAQGGNQQNAMVGASVDPSFQGGGVQKFREWVAANMVYPPIAQENCITGRVVVSFVVKADGQVSNVKVVQGVDPELDKEAVRVVQSSPKWEPGMQNGIPVNVKYDMPINFRLE